MESLPLRDVTVNGRKLAYRELGAGQPVLLLHGWPTSSYLWHAVMPPIARHGHVIALDLPGFGGSDKPIDLRYSFAFFEAMLDGFVAALGLDRVALGVHDLGGPIGLHWLLARPERVTKLALLNTLVYPDVSDTVIDFIGGLQTPGLREQRTSPEGLDAIMRLGVAEPNRISRALLDAIQTPFRDEAARQALALAGVGLSLRGLSKIARRIPKLALPVRILFGSRDALLPNVARTVTRLQRDLPHAVATVLPDCGHFLQLDEPLRVGALLAEFFRV